MKGINSINRDMASGIVLLLAALFALVLNNSSLASFYDLILHTHVTIMIGEYGLDKSLLHFINDGLMAIFFLCVGLEIKHEVLRGDLSSVRKASLPVIAALGGVIFPAIIYTVVNFKDEMALHGWAIPMATDIAFAVGILALLGDRIPKSLKILLLSLAIIDDLMAIIVIAVFYTANLSFLGLGLSVLAFIGAIIINRLGVKRIAPYILIGVVMWVCMLKSGVHATLAGVFLAMAIPIDPKEKGENDSRSENVRSPLIRLERMLKPWVAFMIMPVFAFANAGVQLSGFKLETMLAPIPLGIILGLFIGKQFGVFSAVWLSVKLGISHKPEGVTWAQIYGLAILCGIGFTMSFFIGVLSFHDISMMEQVRVGVLIGSTLSAVIGFIVLRTVCFKQKQE